MAEIVNLRRVRRARDRTAAEAEAATNRAKHGRTREQRESDAAQAAQTRRILDGAKLTGDGEPRE